MSKQANLIFVSDDNHNKFYNMTEQGSSIHVTYGRVGCKESVMTYPLHKWDSLYHSKIKKGYQDVTGYKCETKETNFSIDNKTIEKFVKMLFTKARNQVSTSYLSYKEVSQAQIDAAQEILNKLLEYRTRWMSLDEMNKILLELYRVVPRKMNKVENHLLKEKDIYKVETTKDENGEERIVLDTNGNPIFVLDENGNKIFTSEHIKEKIQVEQDLLDTLTTQLSQMVSVDEEENKNALEVAGLEMEEITSDDEKIIREKLGKNANQFVRAFKVVNKSTQASFDKCLKESKNNKTELLWHGSRTENWWSILSTGLLIRPSNAVYTGSMFGDALYFATKAQKSINYTSLRNSYWAGGSDDRGYLALFEVHVGEQKHVYRHTSDCSKFNYSKIHKENYDSVFAHAGSDLRNDELMVYRPQQCTVKYIVEIK